MERGKEVIHWLTEVYGGVDIVEHKYVPPTSAYLILPTGRICHLRNMFPAPEPCAPVGGWVGTDEVE